MSLTVKYHPEFVKAVGGIPELAFKSDSGETVKFSELESTVGRANYLAMTQAISHALEDSIVDESDPFTLSDIKVLLQSSLNFSEVLKQRGVFESASTQLTEYLNSKKAFISKLIEAGGHKSWRGNQPEDPQYLGGFDETTTGICATSGSAGRRF